MAVEDLTGLLLTNGAVGFLPGVFPLGFLRMAGQRRPYR